MKSLVSRTLGLSLAGLLLLAGAAQAALVSPAGYTNDFSAQPPGTDWATASIAGGATDSYTLDTDVNTSVTAGGVTAQPGPATGTPPAAGASAIWHSTAFYLQTRPTGNRYTVLIAKFVNNTGTNATQVSLSYQLVSPGGGVAEEADRGTRAYYSLTGLAGSWNNLAALNNTISAAGTFPIATNLALNWTNGASLFLLWADDNATGNPTDSGNQFDNFSLQVTAGTPLTLACVISAPGSNAVLVSGASVNAAAAVSAGSPPYTVEYFLSGAGGSSAYVSAGSSATPPFNVSLGALPAGAYNLYAVATDSAITPASVTSRTNNFSVADPIAFALTTPVNNATFDNLTEVTGVTTVSGGSAPYSVQFFLDNVASGATVTSSPYERNFGALSVGDHTVRAVVTDAKGWSSNSATHTVHIAGPLAVTVTPTNGATFNYGDPVTLAATGGGGTPPYAVTFSLDGQSLDTLATPPFTTNLGLLSPGSHTASARITDGATPTPQQAESGTNIITILPNPLLVTLNSPTNGQSGVTGQPFNLAAVVAVNGPVTVTGVQFFFNGASAGVDNTAPYSASVNGPAPGSYPVYAVATDSLGRTSHTATNMVTFAIDPLANNNFANRFTLGTPALVAAVNSGGTVETGEPAGSGFTRWGATLWWKWTAPVNGSVTIDTIGSSFNTYLAVYTGSAVNALTQVAANDNAPGLQNVSLVTFTAQQGTEYQIQVGGLQGFGGGIANGSIQLNLAMPPSVIITSPANGVVFQTGTNIAVNVTAASAAGAITRVDLLRGGTLMGTVSNAPYSFVVSNAPPGTNSFAAVVTDSIGQVATSAVVSVLVANPGITLISPIDGAVFTATNPITVTAFPFLPSGSITQVEFFLDGQPFALDGTAPFSGAWSNVIAGSHRLTANALDDLGNAHIAAPVYIAVTQPLVRSNSTWNYLADGSDQGTSWISPTFNDSGWSNGVAELGYGDNDETTVVPDNSTPGYTSSDADRYITTYFRRAFTASNIVALTNLILYVEYDDAVAVYLNGTQLFRSANLPAGAAYSTLATGSAFEDTLSTATLNLTGLVEGTNVLAAEIHQQAQDSSDISFNLQLLGIPAIVRNYSPVVAIYDPTNTAFLAPATLQFNATATDPDGSIAKVEFFADGIKFSDGGWGGPGMDSYAATWTNPPIGAHVVTAVATDNQGGTTISAPRSIVIYDVAGTPQAQVTSPANGAIMEGPTNLIVAATARAFTGVTNVQFAANGVLFGGDDTAPYTANWSSSFGTNQLTAIAWDANGLAGTSSPVAVVITIPPTNTVAPFVVTNFPAPFAAVTNLTNITIVFSERVQGVDAGDLLVNGVPATSVTGSGSNYAFRFPQPAYGQVDVTWAFGHGITDFGYPANLPFDELGANAVWDYDLVDRTPPTVVVRLPANGSTVTNLSQVSVTFSEAVSGVDAADLLLNGTPAFGLSGSGSNYVFMVSQPPSGTINASWVTNHGIADLALEPNAFNRIGAAWSFTLDSRTVLVQSNSAWRFVKGTNEASTPATAWREPLFDDSLWASSTAPFLYGEAGFTNATIPGTDLGDMANNGYSSMYLRKTFFVSNVGAVTNLLLNHQTDDGLIAWINGVEVFRFNMPTGEVAFNGGALTTATEANGFNGGAAYIVATLTNAAAALVSGTNYLAVHAFNVVTNPASSDFVFNAQLYTFLSDAGVAAPRLTQAMPSAGDVLALTNITVAFSEGVTNVDAADLLVNGIAATNVASVTNTIYTFNFPQPAYGPVAVTWATNHGIVDFDSPPKPFNGALAGSLLNYTLINPSNPRVASQVPSAGTTVTGLTVVAITFTEPVTGVEASDLLVGGTPAGAVSSADNITYNFTFAQPAFGTVTIRWAAGHGIADVEAGNAFDPTRFGGQWNYSLVNPIPNVTLTSPTNGAYILAPANIPLRATATDNDGTIARVEFFESGNKLGEATNAPYTLTWSNVVEGTYTFRAVATDNTGLSATSAPVSVNVVATLPAFLTRGPYLQSGSTTGAVVRWRSDVFTDGVVRYGTDPTTLTNMATEAMQTNEHIVSIKGLLPDTQYFYSIGSSGQRLAGTNGVSSDYWFKTSPVAGTRKPTRLWVLGDPGTAGNGSADRQNSTRDAFYNYAATNGQPDLWLLLGDNAYNSGTDTEHQRAVFDIYPTLLRNHFVWPTIGNHETSQSTTATDFPYLHIFSLPTAGEAGGLASGTEKYYSFDYANIHFVCIDAMTSGRTANSAMAQWIRDDLLATEQDWVIAYFHHSLYTKGTHDSDSESDLVQLRQNIVPILEANGVDLVLMGHSHVYERSYLLDGHYGLSSTLTASMKVNAGDGRADGDGAYQKNEEGRGVVYTIAGSAGQALGGPLNHPAHVISLNELGTVVIDVISNRLEAKFLNAAGQFNDHYTLIKPVPGAPAAPLHLAARFTNHTAVRLTWTDAATNELAYLVERSTDGTNFAEILTTAANTTNVLDPGVVAGTTYFYRVRATNAVTLSDYSNIASASTTNALPIAGADNFYRFVGQNLSVPIASLFANDSDADGDPLALDSVTPVSTQGGAVSVMGQNVLYVPLNGFHGPDSFSYTVADGQGGLASAAVSILVSSNTAPQLTPVSDWIVSVLTPLILTNTATDADQPTNRLTFSLDPGAPAAARLQTNSGRFYWNPARNYANTTNLITVRATDDGVPPLSATTSFNVIVRDYVELTAGETVLRSGDTSSVPLDVTATAGLTALQFAVHFTTNRLAGLSLEPLSPQLTGSSLLPTGPGSALVTFSASAAQPLQGSQTLARLHFTAAGAGSAFVPLEVTDPTYTRAATGLAPSALLNPGRATIIANEPLLEALLGTNNARELMIYGKIGVSYTIETSTSFTPPAWTPWTQVPMTNLYQALSLTNPPTSLLFYRARE